MNEQQTRQPVRPRTRAEDDVSAWEWIIGIASTLFVASVVGFLVYKALTAPRVPPVITAEVREIVEAQGLHVVELWVTNHTSGTAKDVAIEVKLLRKGDEVMTREAALDFVPGESVRRAGVYFPVDPSEYEMRISPIGYDRP